VNASSADLVLRMAGVTVLAFTAILWLRDLRGSLVGVLGALFCFGIISYLLCPLLDRTWAVCLLEVPFFFGCFGVAVFFWLMSRALFDDSFRLRPWHGVLLLVMEALGGWHLFLPTLLDEAGAAFAELPLTLHQLLSLGITVAAVILAFLRQGRRSRREKAAVSGRVCRHMRHLHSDRRRH
jgi:hypothetical protein